MYSYIKNIYYKYLLINPNSRRIILIISSLWNKNIIKTLNSVFFQLNVPSIKIINSLTLPIYNFNRDTALIVEISSDETRILPVLIIL